MENPAQTITFDMDSLRNNLPNSRRGLSRYYSGKSKSFTCMADVQCLEDLKKKEHPDAKKRKKYSERRELSIPSYPCRRVSSTAQFTPPCVGV
ncbi:hypothetical protein MANES_04G086850v8 [Manihot esculenta]|uniref:Uncharacterized protein n=1 Tax=Manihot esculenta TaxID=3983 RepID=A0ACB7HTR8_MANES|nr:hypothetical protein MANES_04G086850v8 [Manihot esculenta]